ncbi:MAG: flavodoxin [Prevotella sp.]|nr:flavodoxin [Prevotella sp.]
MKKVIIAVIALVAIACVITVGYSLTTDNEKVQEETATEQETTQQTVTKVVNRGNGKSLVVYFSVPETDGVDASSGASRVISDGKMMGNTQYVAAIISEATGSDLFEIKTANTYPGSHAELIEAAKQEIDSNARPKLTTHIENLSDYDVVFVGFPNWWYDMPMPLYSFFDEYDFSSKTVIPFCTHGGSRFSDAIKTIRELEKDATVLDGHDIAREQVPDSKEGILEWLEKIGMKK